MSTDFNTYVFLKIFKPSVVSEDMTVGAALFSGGFLCGRPSDV